MKPVALALLFALATLPALAQSAITANAPIKNFRLPVLNPHGERTSLLRGSEARYINPTQIDLVEMQYTTFVAGQPQRVETTLLAPVASVFTENNHVIVRGNESMRLIRDDLQVTGEQWTYEHTPKRILIEKNVRVAFRAEFKDILK